MIKKLPNIIDCCRHCPYCSELDIEEEIINRCKYFFDGLNKILNVEEIPFWCPLEDK